MTDQNLIASITQIEARIFMIRGQKVMLDEDLAALYGIETKRLNEQVRRNNERFPEDFMFQLTADELAALKSQIVTSSLRSQFATSNLKSVVVDEEVFPSLSPSMAQSWRPAC